MSEEFEAYRDEDSMPGEVVDQFTGALLGGAIGDALGSFCEGWRRDEILAVEELMGHYRDRVREGSAVRPGGAYTDDTQQTLVLIESMLAVGRVDPEDIARRLLEMWREEEVFLYGPPFREAMQNLDAGVPWEEAASTDKPSNGAAMKIAPVGLWHWQAWEEIREDALVASYVTHRDPRAVAAAVAMAHTVGHLVTHRPLDVIEVIEVAERSARPVHEATGVKLGFVQQLLEMEEDEAWEAMVGMCEQPSKSGQGIPGEGPATVVVALEAFLRTPTDYEAVVKRALQAGGDVDTFAALAGTLAGVYNGVDALPEHLVAGLLEAGRIRALAVALYEKTVGE